MCGISGIHGSNDQRAAELAVRKMTRLIAHRGPDNEGIFVNEIVALGHRRLAIIDTSAEGNQPFFSEDGKLIMVFNGEVYNYLELKRELEGSYQFKTQSDTEVLLAAYAKWGADCVSHFIGMFAFAIWDVAKESLMVARDRLGIKPLYYVQKDGVFAFASEQRALLECDLTSRKLDRTHLAEYVQYQTVHAPNTILEDVKMMPPAHYFIIDYKGIQKHEFWNPLKTVRSSMDELSVIHKTIRDLLFSAVEFRMRADVNFGAFLSGGIDSSAVVGLMSEIAPGKVNTFSVNFYEKDFDESQWSSQVANLFKTNHHEARVSAGEFLQLIPEALDSMDHPGGDGPNTYVVSKLTRAAGIKMALSGLGGDELFAGYDVFKRMKALESNRWLQMTPHTIRKLGGSAMAKLAPSIAARKIKEILSLTDIDFVNAYPFSRQVFSTEDVELLIYQQNENHNVVKSKCLEINQSTLPLLSRVTMAEISTYMQNVLLRDTDQMSMAHALEVRVPFLDHRLLEYVLSVNDSIKFPHTPKKLLVDSLQGLLPETITQRKKMGFTFPWKLWMKTDLKEMCEENLKLLDNTDYFKPGAMKILWKRFLEDDPEVTWSRVWHLVVLGYWIRKNGINS